MSDPREDAAITTAKDLVAQSVLMVNVAEGVDIPASALSIALQFVVDTAEGLTNEQVHSAVGVFIGWLLADIDDPMTRAMAFGAVGQMAFTVAEECDRADGLMGVPAMGNA